MTKIAFVGAGSLNFTRTLVVDLMAFEEFRDATISLIDIDEERLAYAKRAVERIMEAGGFPATVEATTDRAIGLKDADIVVITILVHGIEGIRAEIEIPMKYGVDFNVGDSYGTAGVFRTLRTLPAMLDICRDVERYAPQAYVFNHTNPMSALCRGVNAATSVRMLGLCHSVQGLGVLFSGFLGVPREELRYECAGINHQAWVLRLEHNGKDAYPALFEALQRPEHFWREPVRAEMCLALGYYVSEQSRQNSEYNWWFRKNPELVKYYFFRDGKWTNGKHAHVLERTWYERDAWIREMQPYVDGTAPVHLTPSEEYTASIAHSLLYGGECVFHATVPNTGLITNMPDQCSVEVPITTSKASIRPKPMGELPKQCALLNGVNTTVVEFAVEAALNSDPVAAFRACCFDPLAAAACSIPQIRQMVRELFEAQRAYLPQFKHTT